MGIEIKEEKQQDPVFIQRIKEFHAKREANDFDLVNAVRHYLKMKFPEHVINVVYDQDPQIISIMNKKPQVQQLVLNRYFIDLLLEYRGLGGYSITVPCYYFTLDIPIMPWLQNFVKKVLGFLELASVFEAMYQIKLNKGSQHVSTDSN